MFEYPKRNSDHFVLFIPGKTTVNSLVSMLHSQCLATDKIEYIRIDESKGVVYLHLSRESMHDRNNND